MANVIKLRKGLDINLKGAAAQELVSVKEPGFYSLVPDDYTGITPKVVVKEQEYVMAGGPLFIDKNHPELKFVSPVSGVVTSVERGARRKVLNIVVEAAAEQDYEEFGKKNVSSLNGESVKAALLEAGMFAFIRQRPYDVIADPTMYPKAIFVSAFDSNPLAPDFEFVLKGEEANFQTGLDALSRMAKTYLSISVKQKSAALVQAKNVTVTAFDGPNPAGNVGVQINHISPIVKGETVWTIGAEAVIFIGRLMNTGRVDLTRTVAVTGSEVLKPAYCKLRVGALLTNVFKGNVTTDKDLRYISGNVLTGKKVAPNGFLGAFDSQLSVIPEGDEIHEMLGWIMPRFNQFSVNRSYFSWLMGKKEYVIDARIKGGERHDRYTLLADRTLEILTEYWFQCGRPRGILFPSSWTGDYLTKDSVIQFFRESAKRAGIQKHVSTHCLRHSFASHLFESGCDVKYIQALLGHRDPKSTEIYLHVSNKTLLGIRSPFDEMGGE